MMTTRQEIPEFSIGDLVWAKMTGYPYWPGIISVPKPNLCAPYLKEPQHFIVFYGSGKNNCSWIPDKNILPHSQDLLENAKNNKIGKKQDLNNLRKAVNILEKVLYKNGVILDKQSKDKETNKKVKPKRKYKKRNKTNEEKNKFVAKKQTIEEEIQTSKTTDFDALLAENKPIEERQECQVENICDEKNKRLEKNETKRTCDPDVGEYSNKKLRVEEETNKKTKKIDLTFNVNENRIELKKMKEKSKFVASKKVNSRKLPIENLNETSKVTDFDALLAEKKPIKERQENLIENNCDDKNKRLEKNETKRRGDLEVREDFNNKLRVGEETNEDIEKMCEIKMTSNDNENQIESKKHEEKNKFVAKKQPIEEEIQTSKVTDFDPLLAENNPIEEQQENQVKNICDNKNTRLENETKRTGDLDGREDINNEIGAGEDTNEDIEKMCKIKMISDVNENEIELKKIEENNKFISKKQKIAEETQTSKVTDFDPLLADNNPIEERQENQVENICDNKNIRLENETKRIGDLDVRKDINNELGAGEDSNEDIEKMCEIKMISDVNENQIELKKIEEKNKYIAKEHPIAEETQASKVTDFDALLTQNKPIEEQQENRVENICGNEDKDLLTLDVREDSNEKLKVGEKSNVKTKENDLTSIVNENRIELKKIEEKSKLVASKQSIEKENETPKVTDFDVLLVEKKPIEEQQENQIENICDKDKGLKKNIRKRTGELDVREDSNKKLRLEEANKEIENMCEIEETSVVYQRVQKLKAKEDSEVKEIVPCIQEMLYKSSEETIDSSDQQSFFQTLFSKEILTNEFWKNKCSNSQALLRLQKISEILKEEIAMERLIKGADSVQFFSSVLDWKIDGIPMYTSCEKTIGLVGTGFFGSSVIRDLLVSKRTRSVWNFSTTKTEEDPCIEVFTTKAKTFRELIENCDIIFSHCKNLPAAKSQMLKLFKSIPKTLLKKKVYVELSTLDSKTVQLNGPYITQKKDGYLEVAILGDIWNSDRNHLVLLASGDHNLFEQCKSTFYSFAEHTYFYPGNPGLGSLIKVGQCMTLSTALAALREVLAFLQSQGLKEFQFTNALNLTNFRDWVEKGKAMFKKELLSKPVNEWKDITSGLASTSNVHMQVNSEANGTNKNVLIDEIQALLDSCASSKQTFSLQKT